MKKTFVAICFSLVVIFAGCSSQGNNSGITADGKYKIGFMGPLSGELAVYGKGAQNATMLAQNVLGENNQYEIVYEDDQCDPIKGVSAFNKLVDNDGVKVIFNHTCSAVTLAIAPLAERKNILLFSSISTAKEITHAGDYIFRNSPSDGLKAEFIAKYIKENHDAAALVTINNDWGIGLRETFSNTFKDIGGEIVVDEVYNQESTDFKSAIAKIKESGVEALLLTSYVNDGALIVKQLVENNYKGVVYAGLDEINDPNFLNIAKNAIDGTIYFPPLKYDGEEATSYETRYENTYGEKAPTFSYEAYDAMMIMAEAISSAGYDSAKIRDYLYQVADYVGASGKITIDENGDVTKSFGIYQFEGTEPKQIGTLQ